MKGQRLIYTESEPNVFYSQDFILGHQTVRVRLDKANNRFAIIDESGNVLQEGYSKNYTVLRSLARKSLKSLGVQIRDEVRKVIA